MSAFGWGLLSTSSLLLGALLALARPWSPRAVALVLAFGAGVLISAVSYELVLEAYRLAPGWVGLIGIAAGALTFYAGNRILMARGGRTHRQQGGAAGNAQAIVLGTILDGVPESVVLGTTLVSGEISIAVLAAIFVSNLPESLSASAGLRAAGTSPGRILGLWTGTALVCSFACLAGFVLMDSAAPEMIAFVQTFAAGALLTMIADTMIPEAFERGGPASGLITVVGFAVAGGLSTLG